MEADLELLKEEYGGGVSLKAITEVEAAVEEAHGTVVATDHHLPSAARATFDPSAHFLGNRALSRQFLLEELKFPPLVHCELSCFPVIDNLADRAALISIFKG